MIKRNLLWTTFTLDISNDYSFSSTDTMVRSSIEKFWSQHVEHIDSNKHVIALYRLSSVIGLYATIGKLQRLNKTDKEYYITLINDIISLKSDEYKNIVVDKIIINFGVRDGLAPQHKTLEHTKIHQNYKHYKLPITMDPFKYGNILHIDANSNTIIVQVTSLTTAKIKQKKDENYVEIYKSGNVILSYVDKVLNPDMFERTIGTNKFIMINEGDGFKQQLFTVKKPAKFIKQLKKEKVKCDKIITMDLETYVKEGIHTPYLISWHDGKITKSYYTTDFESHDDMLFKALSDLKKVKYNNYKVYLHNFAKFDAVFLIKVLIKLGHIIPIIHKGKIITLKLVFSNKTGTRNYSIYFRDSYQILLSSLRDLGKSFNVTDTKTIFPHSFVNESNLNYIGTVPDIKYFDNVTQQEYESYKMSSTIAINNRLDWNIQKESTKYCEIDCISLYQVMTKFNELIFDKFQINVNNYPTLTGLSFAIFRALYLKKDQIPMISGQIYKDIKLSYTGGSTDMYIPTNDVDNNELVYGYDVNSLYPSVMSTLSMPVGKPTYFQGNIRKFDSDAFGFFYCRIKTPDNLNHPILQTHVKTHGGPRTVSALGEYEDMIFSPEMDNAIKLGYHFEILWGYIFDKDVVFKDFVEDLYKFRVEYPKSHPMNYIAKILMNSLYGRFGMDDRFEESMIFDTESYIKFEQKYIESITNVIKLDDNYLVQIQPDDTNTMLDNASENHNVSIGIASAITSHARIIMSQFKNNTNLKLFYTDTDSIYTNLSPEEMNKIFPGVVDPKGLGKLKLESVSKRTIFLSPKVYCLESVEGELIYKVKGLQKTVNLTIDDFETLLVKDSQLTRDHAKWFKSISDAKIEVIQQSYSLKHTNNKRMLVFDSNNILTSTKPYIIDETKTIVDSNSDSS